MSTEHFLLIGGIPEFVSKIKQRIPKPRRVDPSISWRSESGGTYSYIPESEWVP